MSLHATAQEPLDSVGQLAAMSDDIGGYRTYFFVFLSLGMRQGDK